jgi:uncharacterized protein YdaT
MAASERSARVAKNPPVHTVPHDDGWANRREGSSRVSKNFDTKKEAQQAGRETARREHTEHVIHKKDGTIAEKNSYGNDEFPPPG